MSHHVLPHIYVYIHIYIYTHTHTHTHVRANVHTTPDLYISCFLFPQKSHVFPQKSRVFPQKSLVFLQKSPVFLLSTHTHTETYTHKSPVYPQKSLVFPQKSPVFLLTTHTKPTHLCARMCMQHAIFTISFFSFLFPHQAQIISTKENWVSAKEPCHSANSTHTLSHTNAHKSPVYQQKSLHLMFLISAKEPCLSTKEPCVSAKEPCISAHNTHTH